MNQNVNHLGAARLGYTAQKLIETSILISIFILKTKQGCKHSQPFCKIAPQVVNWEFRQVCKEGSSL